MRHSDPLITASRPVMAELVDEIPGIALLCRRYRGLVLCVHQEQGGNAQFISTYERGRARPMLRGAASRIILANMPAPALRKLHEASGPDFVQAGLGADLPEVRASLRVIRQRGYDVTVGDLNQGVTGVAAPVFDGRDVVLGSLSVTLGSPDVPADHLAFVIDRVRFCARIVSKTIARQVPDLVETSWPKEPAS